MSRISDGLIDADVSFRDVLGTILTLLVVANAKETPSTHDIMLELNRWIEDEVVLSAKELMSAAALLDERLEERRVKRAVERHGASA